MVARHRLKPWRDEQASPRRADDAGQQRGGVHSGLKFSATPLMHSRSAAGRPKVRPRVVRLFVSWSLRRVFPSRKSHAEKRGPLRGSGSARCRRRSSRCSTTFGGSTGRGLRAADSRLSTGNGAVHGIQPSFDSPTSSMVRAIAGLVAGGSVASTTSLFDIIFRKRGVWNSRAGAR